METAFCKTVSNRPLNSFNTNRIRKSLLCLITVCILFFFLYAPEILPAGDQQIEDLQNEMEKLYPENKKFTQGDYQKLLDGEAIIEVHTSKADRDDLKLLMDTSFTDNIHEIIDDVRPNNMVETLTILPYSISDPEAAQLVYNVFRSVSDLTSSRYYSQQKDGLHPVFHDSFHVASKDELEPLPDPLVDAIPESESILIHQNPSSLIPVTSRIDYIYRDQQIYIEIDNLTDIRFHFLEFVRLVKPHNMKTIAVVLPLGKASLLYLLGCADTFSFLGIGSDKSEELIYNRTLGMMNYYTDKLNSLEFQTTN